MCRGDILHNEFKVYVPTAKGIDDMQNISYRFDELLTMLDHTLDNCRELALVRTHLEIACFYARKAKAREPLAGQKTGICEHGHATVMQTCPVCFPNPISVESLGMDGHAGQVFTGSEEVSDVLGHPEMTVETLASSPTPQINVCGGPLPSGVNQ